MPRVARFVLFVAGVLSACGAASRPVEHVAHASRAPAAATYRLTIVSARGGSEPLLDAHGAFDATRHRYWMTLAITSVVAGLDGSMRVVATGDTMYVDAPSLVRVLHAPTRWISAPVHDDVLGGLLPDPIALLDAAPTDDVEVDRDADGLVHRVVVRFDAGNPGGVVVTLDYSDIGQPVAIDPPPPEQVTDESTALQGLAGRTGG